MTIGAFLLAPPAFADVAITLNNDFIGHFKNRATIDAQYTVAHAHAHANPAAKDGDLHCAGSAPEIGLACVAEVMNAKAEAPALAKIHGAESSGEPIPMTGVWRIWPEHAGSADDFEQFAPVDPIATTNPPHVFEMHPLTVVDGVDVRDGFHNIVGFTYKTAADAFARYEALPCEIERNGDKTTLTTREIGFNYVKFRAELLEDPTHALDDGGLSVFATVPGADE